MNCGEFRAALTFAQRFHRLAVKQPDPADRLIADRMIGTVLRFMGDLSNARRRIERMLDRMSTRCSGRTRSALSGTSG